MRFEPSGSDLVRIVKVGPEHLDSMVDCHAAAFPGFFMTEMGSAWLRGLYRFYQWHRGGISVVAVDAADEVLGFVVGGETTIRDEFLSGARFRYAHLLGWKFLTVALVRKKLLAEIQRRLRLGRGASAEPESARPPAGASRVGDLLSIGVLPRCKGSDVAGRLIEAFAQAGAARGYEKLELCVSEDNHRAIAFYEKQNWYEVMRRQSDVWFRYDLHEAEQNVSHSKQIENG